MSKVLLKFLRVVIVGNQGELPNINITYHNVSEIVKQLENPPKIEELSEDLNESEELPDSIELKLNN